MGRLGLTQYVNDLEQLEALAGSPDWFFRGSLIIFTGKDKQLLRSHKVDELYEMKTLDYYKALELFSLNAFGKRHPTEVFEEFASEIVKYLHGHPLALKVIGRSLYEKSVDFWKSKLERLQTYPNSEIVQKLRPSFDSLASDEKRMFLDIACAFIGEKKDFAASVHSSNSSANANIEVLVDKFLITVSPSTTCLQMHELIQCMAREIIREEFSMFGNHSKRLWISSEDDILNVNKVAEEVEVLVLLLNKNCQNIPIDGKALTRMKNLRILKICFPKVEGRWQQFAVNFSGRLDLLSNKLRLLYWHGLPLESLPSNFYPENIVAIDLSYSHIKQLWTTPKCLRRLKVMKLSYCCNLTTTPDFSEIKNLEELNLEGCVNLVTVHPSIGMLKRLVVLNMRDCRRALNLSGCLNVNQQLPEAFWSRCCTSITCFIWNQQHPQRSVSLAGLHMLKSLNFSYCNLVQVPDAIGGLSFLKTLELEGNNFTSLPGSLRQLSHLHHLIVDSCKKLEVLPELPPSLDYIDASHCISVREVSVSSKDPFRRNRTYVFSNCPKLLKNVTIDSEGSITSQGSIHLSALGYMGFQTNRCEFFSRDIAYSCFDIMYHANSIPEWFTNRSKGNHVKVELPSDWCLNKFRGYGFCVVFKRKKPYEYKGFSVKNYDGASLLISQEFEKLGEIGIQDSYMIWLRYTKWGTQKWKEAKNFVTFSFQDDELMCNEIAEVKECGVRLICDEDIEQEADLSMLQGRSTPTQHDGMYIYLRGERFKSLSWSW